MLETVAAPARPQVHLWTRDEYLKMAEVGLFEGKHVELIEGQVIEMSAMGVAHMNAVTRTARRLERVFGQQYLVLWQMPFDVDRRSLPEPDIAVVPGSEDDYETAPPRTAALLVEVADSSLAHDRTTKARLYAQAGVPEYWIVNLLDRQLEVHRRPEADGYQEITVFTGDASVTLLAAPDAQITVADLLPKVR